MDAQRVVAWIVAPILSWALVVGAIIFASHHPVAALRVTYIVGILGTAGVMARQWRSSRTMETMLAALVCVACADVMGVL
jgi:hypothetical protein